MKIATQIFLVIFFILLYLVVLVSATAKFQLLSYSFWQTSFQKHNIYQNIAAVGKISFESQIRKEGGKKDDIKIFTDLITKENAKDTVDRNLRNFLSFVNGASPEINVYLPIDKIPRSLLPMSISGIKTEMTLQQLLARFNYQDWQNLPLQSLSHTGTTVNLILGITVFLLLLVAISLVFLAENGERFIGLGIAFLISGGFTFLMVNLGMALNTVLLKDFVSSASIVSVLFGTIFPPVITDIVSTWRILSLCLFAIGIVLFFIRKPGYNTSK